MTRRTTEIGQRHKLQVIDIMRHGVMNELAAGPRGVERFEARKKAVRCSPKSAHGEEEPT